MLVPITAPPASACALLLAFALSAPAAAAEIDEPPAEIRESPVFEGVMRRAEVVAWSAVDLSGDGRREVIVAFKEPGEEVGVRGGLLVFASRMGRVRKAFGGLWEKAYPREMRVRGRTVELIVVERTPEGELPLEQTLLFGEDIVFDDRPGGILEGVTIEASSTLRHFRAQTEPSAVLDGDLGTGWAEAGRGTGVGEWIRLSFEKPIAVSWLGMASGDHRSEDHRLRSNRVHRAEIAVRTEAEEGDPMAGLSYQDLGLDFPGERVPVRMRDRPGLQYTEVDRAEVRALEMRISSVYVGDRFDDTWITSVDLLGRLPAPPLPSFVVAPLEE